MRPWKQLVQRTIPALRWPSKTRRMIAPTMGQGWGEGDCIHRNRSLIVGAVGCCRMASIEQPKRDTVMGKRKHENEVLRTMKSDPIKRGRPKKEDAPPAFVSKHNMELLALDSGKIMLAEHGCTSDPEYQDLLLMRLVEQGIPRSRAAELVGYKSRTQGTRVMEKARRNPRFKAKLIELHDRMREAYIGSKVASLPMLSEIESAALEEYKADPRLAIEKPKLLRDLRIVSGVQDSGGVIQNNLSINIEALQKIVKGDFSDVVTVEPVEASE
jgi:hypothetical protein